MNRRVEYLSEHRLIGELRTTYASFRRRAPLIIQPDAYVDDRPLYLLENLEAIRRLFQSTLSHPVVATPILA